MKNRVIVFVLTILCFFSLTALPVFADTAKSGPLVENGILVVAYSGYDGDAKTVWNKNIQELVNKYIGCELGYINIETAFGRGDFDEIQKAVSVLENKGVKRIIAMPLLISNDTLIVRKLAYTLDAKTVVPKEKTDDGIVKHNVPIWMSCAIDIDNYGLNKPFSLNKYIKIWLLQQITNGLNYFRVDCGSG